MLALPAKPRLHGERLFSMTGARIDEDLHVFARSRGNLAGQFLELALDNVVIVAIAGIDGRYCRDPASASLPAGRRSGP